MVGARALEALAARAEPRAGMPVPRAAVVTRAAGAVVLEARATLEPRRAPAGAAGWRVAPAALAARQLVSSAIK